MNYLFGKCSRIRSEEQIILKNFKLIINIVKYPDCRLSINGTTPKQKEIAPSDAISFCENGYLMISCKLP
ncbi:MAG TPA: hypothetical protein DCQ58_05970, partial [Saprospirales bacterium]|nr:hypothetical protein [Saprospirales bacterium]